LSDFGTADERAVALRVCEACIALNKAVSDAACIDVNVKIVDTQESWDDQSILRIARMERRTTIVPTSPNSEENAG
jgi:hypothetical protein